MQLVPTFKIITAALMLSLTACKDEAAAPAPAPASPAAVPAPADAAALNAILSSTKIEAAQGIAAAVAAKPALGSTITVTGRIGGAEKPFGDFATLILAQADVKSCNEQGEQGDECDCPTPWDMCCDALKGNLCSIQVNDANGKLIRSSLRGIGGLKELSTITVTGKVSASDEGLLVINAEKIFVDKP